MNNKTLINNEIIELPQRMPDKVFLWVFGIYISWQISGFVGSIPGLRGYFNLSFALLTIGLSMLLTRDFLNKFLFRDSGWLIIISFMVIGLSLFLTSEKLDFLLSFLPVIVYMAANTYLSEKKASKGLLVWFMLNIIYKIILTLYWLTKDNLIVKRYDHNGFAGSDGITRSVIGYGAIYMIVPFIFVLLSVVKIKEKKMKILIWITAISSVVLVYMSQVSMMIFSLTALLALYVIIRNDRKMSWRIIIIFAFIGLVYLFRVQLLTWLGSFDFLGDTVQNRITSLANVLNNDMEYVNSQYSGSMVEGDSVVNRFYSYSLSFSAMFHNFFLGYLTPGAFEGAGHSSMIDLISRYGIFAALPLIVVIFRKFKLLIKAYPKSRNPIIIVLIYIIAICCLNNLAFSTIFMLMYFLIPQYGELYKECEGKTNEGFLDCKRRNTICCGRADELKPSEYRNETFS